jgi:hypothetical protein
MWMLAGSTTWLESQEDLDRLLPLCLGSEGAPGFPYWVLRQLATGRRAKTS